MVQFPQEAHFICRKCRSELLFRPENFGQTGKASDIRCSGCGAGAKASQHKIATFFRFYPRFTAALSRLTSAGFPLSGYGIHKSELAPRYQLISLTFACAPCGKEQRVDLHKARAVIDEPKLFFCRNCRHHPATVSMVKECFVSAINLNQAALSFRELQWDIFSPNGFELEWVDL